MTMLTKDIDHLSASALRQLSECGLRFKFARIERLPPETRGAALIFGSAYHAAVAIALERLRFGKKTSPEMLADSFLERWDLELSNEGPPVQWPASKSEAQHRELGLSMLTCWRENAYPVYCQGKVLEVERTFEFTLDLGIGPVELVGIIDLVYEDSQGRTILTDHKTAQSAAPYESELFLENDLQASIYWQGAQEIGYTPDAFSYHIVTKAKTPKFRMIGARRGVAAEVRLAKAAEAAMRTIEAGAYLPAHPDWRCSTCAWKRTCQAWGETAG